MLQKNIVPYFSDAAKSSTSQYSVESTVTSRVANVLCFFLSCLAYSSHICADLFPHRNNEDAWHACKLFIYLEVYVFTSITQQKLLKYQLYVG